MSGDSYFFGNLENFLEDRFPSFWESPLFLSEFCVKNSWEPQYQALLWATITRFWVKI